MSVVAPTATTSPHVPHNENDGSSSYYEPTEPDTNASSNRDRRRHDRAFYRHAWESGYPELQRLCRLPDQEKPHPSSWKLDDFLDLMMDKAATVRRLNARKKKGLPLQDEDEDDGRASVYSTDSVRVWKIRFRIIRALLPSVWRVDDQGNDEQVKEDVVKKWESCVEELGEIDEPAPEHKGHAATRDSPEISDSDVDVYEEANDAVSRTSELPDALTRSMEETIYESDSQDTKAMVEELPPRRPVYERPTVHDISSEPALVPAKTPLGALVEEPPEVSPVSTRPVSTMPSVDDVYTTPAGHGLPALPRQFPPHVMVDTYSDVGRYLASTKRIVSLAGPPSDNVEYSIIITALGQEGALIQDAAAGIIPNGTEKQERNSRPRPQMQPTAESVSDEGDTYLGGSSPLSPMPNNMTQMQRRSIDRATSPIFPTEAELESQFDLMARKLLRRVLVTSPEDLDNLIAESSARFSSQAVADLVMRRIAELVGVEGQAGQKATFIQKLRVATLQRTQPSMRMRPPSPTTAPLPEVTSAPSSTRPIVEHARTAPAPETLQLRSGVLSRRASAISEGVPQSPSGASVADGMERPLSAIGGTLKTRASFRNKFRESWRKMGKQQT